MGEHCFLLPNSVKSPQQSLECMAAASDVEGERKRGGGGGGKLMRLDSDQSRTVHRLCAHIHAFISLYLGLTLVKS